MARKIESQRSISVFPPCFSSCYPSLTPQASLEPTAKSTAKVAERQVPVYNADGSPKMEEVTETITAKTYNSKGRGTGCGLLGGATAGALAGTLAAGPVGTVVGALVGAAAGTAIGVHSAKGDKLEERWVSKDINHPSMDGYNEYTLPVPEFHRREDKNGEKHTDVSLKGYYHHYGPEIENKKVGSYDQPEIAHSRPGRRQSRPAHGGRRSGHRHTGRSDRQERLIQAVHFQGRSLDKAQAPKANRLEVL